MSPAILLLAALAFAPDAAVEPSLAAPAAPARAEEPYAELLDEYELAEEAFDARVRAAEPRDRRALREEHPAREYWPRFERAAQAGEGRAYVWMLKHARDKGLRTSEARAAARPMYERLFADHVGAPWFGEVLAQLYGDRRDFEVSELKARFERAVTGSELPEIQAQAMVLLARVLAREEDPALQAEAKAWLARAAKEHPTTQAGMMARAELEKPVIGEPAPDFSGRTIEGHEFQLSDYRGKVVLLDFYGFW